MEKPKFHYLARGVIVVDGKVLLAHRKGADNTFLPGGHIKRGEGAMAALIRELEEELGLLFVIKGFIGAVEFTWLEGERNQHEINLLFEATAEGLDSNVPLQSLEEQLRFIWSSPEDLASHNLQPFPLVSLLVDWEAGKYYGFWGSSFLPVNQ